MSTPVYEGIAASIVDAIREKDAELTRLRAENEALLAAQVIDSQRIYEWRTKAEGYKADVERYRWLVKFVSNEEMERITGRWPTSDEEADAAIDEARAARKETQR